MSKETEGKTLKDLKKLTNNKGEEFILYSLKQEAIKWVKAGEYDFPDILIDFLNITEEDLK